MTIVVLPIALVAGWLSDSFLLSLNLNHTSDVLVFTFLRLSLSLFLSHSPLHSRLFVAVCAAFLSFCHLLSLFLRLARAFSLSLSLSWSLFVSLSLASLLSHCLCLNPSVAFTSLRTPPPPFRLPPYLHACLENSKPMCNIKQLVETTSSPGSNDS